MVLHVAFLTGVYSLMQLIFAPLWGRLSDRIGRRPLILLGIAGYVVAQVMFGVSTSLWLLYVARVGGGILSSATLPVSAAYVADMTTTRQRSRGMAWLGTAASLGVVVGPAVGGLLATRDWHLRWSTEHLKVDSFSIPFFAAALVGAADDACCPPVVTGIPSRPADKPRPGRAKSSARVPTGESCCDVWLRFCS